jgi:hypothetical protein
VKDPSVRNLVAKRGYYSKFSCCSNAHSCIQLAAADRQVEMKNASNEAGVFLIIARKKD